MAEGWWIPHRTVCPSLTDYCKSYLGSSPLHSLYKNKQQQQQQYNKNNNNNKTTTMVYMNTAAEEARDRMLSSKHMFIHGCQICFPWNYLVMECLYACACVCAWRRGSVCMHLWELGTLDQNVQGQTASNGSSSMKTHLKPRTSKCLWYIYIDTDIHICIYILYMCI